MTPDMAIRIAVASAALTFVFLEFSRPKADPAPAARKPPARIWDMRHVYADASPKSFRDMASYARARVGVDRIGASFGPGCRPSDRTPSDFAPAGIHPSRVEI